MAVRAKRAQHVMVDTARVVRQIEAGRRVEGMTIMQEEIGPPFKCRLHLEGPVSQRPTSAVGGRRPVLTDSESILYDTASVDGATSIALSTDDVIEVVSDQPGASGRWAVDGVALTIRAKTELLGLGYAKVRRVVEG